MFLRLLIIIILGIVVYRATRSWFGQGSNKQQRMSGQPTERIDDDMVQDPQCGIYFPRRQGIVLADRGRELLFCSEACKQTYEQEHKDI